MREELIKMTEKKFNLTIDDLGKMYLPKELREDLQARPLDKFEATYYAKTGALIIKKIKRS